MCNSWLLLIIALTVVCLWNSQQTETSKSCPAECICLSQTQVSLTMSVEPPSPPLPLASLSPSPNPPLYSTCSSASCLHCAASSSSASVETWPASAARRVCDLLLPCKLIKPQVTQLLLMRWCSNLQCCFCI